MKIASDFHPVMNGGIVTGDGERYVDKLLKYSYTWGVKYVSICDASCLILGILGGERAQYYNAQTRRFLNN